jgi:hypothetical protein
MPVLYLCGRYDGATPGATAWYQSLTPGAELVVFEESSHVPHVEEPVLFLSTVREFLRRVAAVGAARSWPGHAAVTYRVPGYRYVTYTY